MREIKLKQAKKRELTESAWDLRKMHETWQSWQCVARIDEGDLLVLLIDCFVVF